MLKQLNYLVGDTAFQAGVRRFLARTRTPTRPGRICSARSAQAARAVAGRVRAGLHAAAGMPVVEQRLDGAGREDRAARAGAAAAVSGAGCGPAGSVGPACSGRLTDVRPGPSAPRCSSPITIGPPLRLPVKLRGGGHHVTAAAGRPAPDFVFANARDYGYFLLLLDSASVARARIWRAGQIDDAFLRAMLWGALWDQVRALPHGSGAVRAPRPARASARDR